MIKMIKGRMMNLLSSDGSLQQKTIKSGFWSFGSRLSTRGLDLIKLVIVARLLSPDDFGLLGMAILAMAVFQVFTETGFKDAIIQNKNDVKCYLNTAWTTLIIRGIILYVIVFFSAPYVALFFGEPRAGLIIQVLGLTIVLDGLQNIAVVLLRKELEFQKQFVLNLGGSLPSFILTVLLAFILKDVWALVYGSIIGRVGMIFISYLVHSYKPRLEFHLLKAKELFIFGKWILAASIVIFIATNGDNIFVGRYLGAFSLGLYALAFSISNITTTEITHVIGAVAFPAYTKIQEDQVTSKKALSRTIRTVLTISIPISIAIILFIPEFTKYILGEQWIAIIWPVRILAIAGLLRSVSAAWGAFYLSKGKPKYDFYKNLVKVIGIFSTIYFLTQYYGIIGTSLAVLIGQIFDLILGNFLLNKLISYKYNIGQSLDYLKGIILSLTVSSVLYFVAIQYIISFYSFLLISSVIIIIFIMMILLTEKINFNPAIKEMRENLSILNKE
jgi:lipopolysaccharide exporter